MKKMFSAALGEYDFSDFDKVTEVKPWIAHVLFAFYLIVMLITLLNFIIAVLSDTYSILSQKSQSLYLREVIYQRQKNGHT